jgi:glycosyltransferase involved in cell wall biosynthesis
MIIYLGNNLSIHGNTPSSIETLGKFLESRYTIKRFSDKRNQIIRGLDMMISVIRYNQSASVVLIDTYSSLGFYYALGAAFLCRLFSIPYIPILRGGNLTIRLSNNPILSKYLFGRAALLIAPSRFLMTKFNDFGFTNIKYIPNSIELPRYTYKARTTMAPKLLWVRSFHQVYNPLMAIDVLGKIISHFPGAELCMVGPDKDGSFARCKEYAKECNLAEFVTFTGVLSKSQWLTHSQQYDIFINTTTVDNTPVSVIEAMALGLPIVSTNVGGVPFLIADNENGLLVKSGNVDAMASKIEFLISNPSFSFQLAQRARAYVESFDWAVIKDSWFTLLDKFETPSKVN